MEILLLVTVAEIIEPYFGELARKCPHRNPITIETLIDPLKEPFKWAFLASIVAWFDSAGD